MAYGKEADLMMQMQWPAIVSEALQNGQPVCRIIIASVKGSSPRETATYMFVTASDQKGTIGGGTLEYEAVHFARNTLKDLPQSGFVRHLQDVALGPDLGQCCGGNVKLVFEAFAPSVMSDIQALMTDTPSAFVHDLSGQSLPAIAPRTDKSAGLSGHHLYMPDQNHPVPLYIYGAGHVGRALINVTHSLGLKRIWIDTDKKRFPDNVPGDVTIVPAKDMSVIASHAPQGAFHIVLTYSHAMDEAIIASLLSKAVFGQVGLIGSKTKKARFTKRLQTAGISSDMISKMHCPVGLAAIGDKSPPHVALSIAGQIAVWIEEIS
ncbi:MAG: xanthine dehydrogenase accessory protein XdhC [Candidatus Puniceispirillaceae bacterium]